MGKEEAAFLLGLSNWLCGKNEGALRLEFDLIGMLENNIDLMTKNHGPLNEKQRNNIDVLFSMGHIRLSRQIAPGVQFGPGDWAVNPGEVGFLVFTNKYKAAETRLDEAILSTLVPSDVVQHLINFRSIVKYDMQGAIEELNYGYKYNPKFIFDSKKKGTPYFAVIRDRYAAKSIGLRPPVEIACDLIGKHLRSGTP